MRTCRSGKFAVIPAPCASYVNSHFASCCGAFMSAEDTKPSRTDSPDHEYVALQPMTNYDGYVYWGEYPLSFAACLAQVRYQLHVDRLILILFAFLGGMLSPGVGTRRRSGLPGH